MNETQHLDADPFLDLIEIFIELQLRRGLTETFSSNSGGFAKPSRTVRRHCFYFGPPINGMVNMEKEEEAAHPTRFTEPAECVQSSGPVKQFMATKTNQRIGSIQTPSAGTNKRIATIHLLETIRSDGNGVSAASAKRPVVRNKNLSTDKFA